VLGETTLTTTTTDDYGHGLLVAIAKNYKALRQNKPSMKIDNLIMGTIVIAFAALLLADAIQTTYTPANQILSPNDVKGITGMVFVVIAALIFVKAFVRAKQ